MSLIIYLQFARPAWECQNCVFFLKDIFCRKKTGMLLSLVWTSSCISVLNKIQTMFNSWWQCSVSSRTSRCPQLDNKLCNRMLLSRAPSTASPASSPALSSSACWATCPRCRYTPEKVLLNHSHCPNSILNLALIHSYILALIHSYIEPNVGGQGPLPRW